jgi:hypothetical protein
MFQHLMRVSALIVLVACSGDDDGKPEPIPTDASSERDGSVDAAERDTDAAAPIEPTMSPRYTTRETALTLQPQAPPALISVYGPAQPTYYRLKGKAGDFYLFWTERGQFTPNNVITLLDEAGERIAENDDGAIWPGDQIDARLIVRLPTTGTYYVRVIDETTPAEQFSGGPLGISIFHLTAQRIGTDTSGITLAASDATAPVQFIEDPQTGYSYATVVGELRAGTLESFSLVGLPAHALIGHLLPGGAEGDGSTSAPSSVRVLAGERTVAQIEGSGGLGAIHPPVGDDPYLLELQAGDEPGDNGFYAVNLVLLPDNPREQAEQENGKLLGAEIISSRGTSRTRGLILSTLPPNDVDYYRFEAMQLPVSVLVGCEGESAGSGVRGLRAELRDSQDRTLIFSVESPTENLRIEPYQLPSAGSYYLRLSSETPAADDQPEPWTRCVVVLGG